MKTFSKQSIVRMSDGSILKTKCFANVFFSYSCKPSTVDTTAVCKCFFPNEEMKNAI